MTGELSGAVGGPTPPAPTAPANPYGPCRRCGSEHVTEVESVPVNRRGEIECWLVCEDCGRRQYQLGGGRGVL